VKRVTYKLTARAATGEMCRRHPNTVAGRRAWTPALLRWARRTPRVVAGATRWRAPIASWASYFHLHFHVSAIRRGARESGASYRDEFVSRGDAPPRWRRLFADSSEGKRNTQEQGGVVRPRLIRVFASGSAAVMRHAARVDRAGHSATTIHRLHSTLARAYPTASRMPYERSRKSVRIRKESTRRQPAALALRAGLLPYASPSTRQRIGARADMSSRSAISNVQSLTSRIHSPVQRTWRVRQEAARALETHASPRLQALIMKRPADLVWRANAGTTTTSNDSAGNAMTSASARSAAAPLAPSRKPDATVVCATALDPALAARFADDVIRRIDRRARIERERRGP
jgi:hypothetical protein